MSRRRRGSGRLLALALTPCLALAGLHPPAARASIGPATVVAGPSGGILGVGNVALAPDGTGGVVWRQLQDGVPHIFVSRFAANAWGPPIEVDPGQAGPDTFPAIAAADGGELLVVWVSPWASESVSGQPPTTHDQLYSSVLQPGADGFGPPQQVDASDVGDGTGVFPALAMAPGGAAYVVYRVVTNPLTPGVSQPPGTISPMRPGDELIDVRVARFNGLTWSSLGAVNALPGQVTMRKPTAANAPAIAIDRTGEGIVVWQEPDISGTARIWARRLFGSVPGFVLAATPATLNSHPVSADADAPGVSFGDYANAAVTYRLAGGAGNPLGHPEAFVNPMTDKLSPGGGDFLGAVPVAGAAGLGVPSVSVDDSGDFQSAFAAAGTAQLVSGTLTANRTTIGAPVTVGGASGDTGFAALDPEGGGAMVWPSINPSGNPVVDVRDALPDGGLQSASLSAPVSGPISGLSVGSAGDGSALVAFQQGASTTSQVVVDAVESPPRSFGAVLPGGWVRRTALVTWTPAASTDGGVTYAVAVGGRVVAAGLETERCRLALGRLALGQGIEPVQIIATDASGQRTLTPVAELRIDRVAPFVSVRQLRGRRVEVIVHDPGSGTRTGATVMSFGDRTPRVRRRDVWVHRYAAPGVYRLTVRCADRAGNRAVDHIFVVIR